MADINEDKKRFMHKLKWLIAKVNDDGKCIVSAEFLSALCGFINSLQLDLLDKMQKIEGPIKLLKAENKRLRELVGEQSE